MQRVNNNCYDGFKTEKKTTQINIFFKELEENARLKTKSEGERKTEHQKKKGESPFLCVGENFLLPFFLIVPVSSLDEGLVAGWYSKKRYKRVLLALLYCMSGAVQDLLD